MPKTNELFKATSLSVPNEDDTFVLGDSDEIKKSGKIRLSFLLKEIEKSFIKEVDVDAGKIRTDSKIKTFFLFQNSKVISFQNGKKIKVLR